MQKNAWTLGIYSGATPFRLIPADANPVLVPEDVTDMDVDILAHPFLMPTASTFWMFFTAKQSQGTEHSAIGVAESHDGLAWKYRQIVLREPHVISYPQVIHWQGQHYMIAESYDEKFVRLYRATEFPFQWTRERDLLTGDHFVSPSVVRYADRWWMFAGGLDNASLRLFHAADLLSPWTEHAISPIIANDLHAARPAGRPVMIDGALYRMGQDCLPTYGRRVFAFRVTEISPTTYKEEMIPTPVITATDKGWNAEAMHHVDAHHVNGRWIAAVDAKGTREA